MSLVDKVEKKISDKVRELVEKVLGPAESSGLLEIHRAILEEVEGHIQPIRKGVRVFPFKYLAVRIAAPEGQPRAAFEIAFTEGQRLEQDIRERLEQVGCPPAAGFQVDVELGAVPGDQGFIIECQRQVPPDRQRLKLPPARLVVIKGRAAEASYALRKRRLDIGRLAEVLDEQQRLLRRNDVVFPEGADPANATVSRQHAHIEFDEQAGAFRIHDDASSYGTRLLRENQAIPVPAGAARGIKLQVGDEIFFGQAAVRFEA